MKGLFSTAYWAPVQYFAKLAVTSETLLEQHEHYSKQTYRNRCRIATANGVLALTVPVIKTHGAKMPIRDVRIDYTERWQHNHWKAIESAYRSSPFFDYYAGDIRPFYERKEPFLFDLNEQILHIALELIGLKITVGYTDAFVSEYPEHDFRYIISPKRPYTMYDPKFKPQIYYQVFAPANGFAANMSILDLLYNEGTNALQVLRASVADGAY
ncbi:MAG: WbqC family protein [Prevotellaceae bacterium]|nr:WbqC family protein [Prevotellaceae bacterium]